MSRPDSQAISIADALMSAICCLNVDKVEQLLKNDLEIEYECSDNSSVLHAVVELLADGVWRSGRAQEKSNKKSDQKKSNKKFLNKFEAFRKNVKVLLESGRFNVDALRDSCQTALHVAVQCCKCKEFSSYDYKDLVNAIIGLLLQNKANINAKTSKGETPLMKASELGCSNIVKFLLEWRDEFGAGVDLNARDMFGETALIKAAKSANADVVQLLLKHGCLDKFQDHRGFYALHAAIYGPGLIGDVPSDFFQSIGVDASETAIQMLDRYGGNTILVRDIRNNLDRFYDKHNIVTMLVGLTSGRSDVSSLDFRGNTALDLAIKSKLRVSEETVDMLMKVMNKDSEYRENTFLIANKLGKTPIHRLSVARPDMLVTDRFSVFDSVTLDENSPFKELFDSMAVTRDHRGRTALHYAAMTQIHRVAFEDYGFVLKNVLKLTHIVNERDNYGRTALHYCQSECVYESLVKQGSDEHIQDNDGKTPQDFKQLRKKEQNRHDFSLEVNSWLRQCKDDESNLDESKDDECKNKVGPYKDGEYKDVENMERIDEIRKLLNQPSWRKLDAWMIWTDSRYAYRDQFSRIMCDKVQEFINKLSDGIGKMDPRFECRPVLIGSAEEGTKTGLPDEFDYNLILTRLSELCEVVPAPEAPSGFVHLKRRLFSSDCRPTCEGLQSQEDFDKFFSSNGILLTTEIATLFRILYLEVMGESKFWDDKNVFERDPSNEIGLFYLKDSGKYVSSKIPNDLRPSTHLCTSIRLRVNRPIDGIYVFTEISLDIVPCMKVKGWWPDDALSSVNDKIKLGGCHLVFDQPQDKYPWVPFSDPFARISFAPAESRLIKECSAVAKAAYMVGKQLLYYFDESKRTYILKTCLLYCIEALKENTRNVFSYEDIDPSELRIFVEKLMLCFHEFYQQDFLPCYLMPSFHLPMDDWLKSNHDQLLNDSFFKYPIYADMLYSSVCTTEFMEDFYPPAAEPLNEKFNREKLLMKLSTNYSSYFEHLFVQPGPLVESDSQSESHVRLSENRKRIVQISADRIKVKRQCCTDTK